MRAGRMRHRWKSPGWGESNLALTPIGWRLLCCLENCTSPRHWTGWREGCLDWTVMAYCALEPATQALSSDLVRSIAPYQQAVGWFRVRELTYSAALARLLAERMDENLLLKLTSAIEATADLVWREYGPQRRSEYSVIGMISGPRDENWWFGLLIQTDQFGRIELGIATTAEEVEAILGIEPLAAEENGSPLHS